MTYKATAFRCAAPIYPTGTIRYRRVICCEDVRLYRPAEGWSATSEHLEYHPITDEPLLDKKGKPCLQWWIIETKDDHDDDV